MASAISVSAPPSIRTAETCGILETRRLADISIPFGHRKEWFIFGRNSASLTGPEFRLYEICYTERPNLHHMGRTGPRRVVCYSEPGGSGMSIVSWQEHDEALCFRFESDEQRQSAERQLNALAEEVGWRNASEAFAEGGAI